MRLYLSSLGLGPQAGVLTRPGGRAAIIANALDPYADRLAGWDREAEGLARLGYDSDELDLRDFWACPESLVARLRDVDLLWVLGGNTFVLARAATAAGLGPALAESPHLSYAGYSAGACLTSVDLRGIEAMDDPAELPTGYREDMPATTLALTGTRIVPHAGVPEAEEALRRLRDAGLEHVALADGEDLLLDV